MTSANLMLAVVTLCVACITPINAYQKGGPLMHLMNVLKTLMARHTTLHDEFNSFKSSTEETLAILMQNQANLAANSQSVGFLARKTDIQSLYNGTRITFDQSLANHGGYYSDDSSTFTCNDQSVYVFVATILSKNGAPTYFAIAQDGVPKGSGYTGNSPGKSSGTEMAIIECQPGRRVWVMCHSGLMQHQKAWHHSYFGGFRL